MCDGVRLHAESGTRRRPPFVRQDQNQTSSGCHDCHAYCHDHPLQTGQILYKKSGPEKEKAMSIFYSLAYSIGFAPWEKASTHRPAAQQVKALFDDRR